jgi:hypothetical protein
MTVEDKRSNIKKILLVVGVLLVGCARPYFCAMIYNIPDHEKADKTSKYYHNILVSRVIGWEETICHDKSPLGNAALCCALRETLKEGNYLTPGDTAGYVLEVQQESLETLSQGTVQEARVVLRVILCNRIADEVIFNEKFASTVVAAPQDSFLPASRMRIAIERATRNCIKQITQRLKM